MTQGSTQSRSVSSQDLFVHFLAIETDDTGSLDEDRRVEFDIIQGQPTRPATHVRCS
jgi:cold shock CspA family protein